MTMQFFSVVTYFVPQSRLFLYDMSDSWGLLLKVPDLRVGMLLTSIIPIKSVSYCIVNTELIEWQNSANDDRSYVDRTLKQNKLLILLGLAISFREKDIKVKCWMKRFFKYLCHLLIIRCRPPFWDLRIRTVSYIDFHARITSRLQYSVLLTKKINVHRLLSIIQCRFSSTGKQFYRWKLTISWIPKIFEFLTWFGSLCDRKK